MQYLLSRMSRPVLTRLGREQTLCAFDFDGTLAPIVVNPAESRMRREVRSLLALLAERYPCIVISGRARADLLEKLREVRVARVIGNHGAETEQTGKGSRRHVRQWQMALASSLRSVPGLWVEDKGLSLTVHYRQCPRKLEARRRIYQVVRTLQHVRAFGGKQVVNLVEADAPHKGDVLAGERNRLACNWVLYVGDDVNDEDAFELSGNIVSVRIGRTRMSHASYYLRTQSEIQRLLELLCIMRPSR
jgi:trehalose 6-phosphate phosphatase